MKEFAFIFLIVLTPIFAWGHPALASMLPLATTWRKAAWVVWLVVLLIGAMMFQQAYFVKSFVQLKSLFEEKPLSLESIGYFVAAFGSTLVTLGFWLVRRPARNAPIGWVYRSVVVFAAYLPLLSVLGVASFMKR
jgi:hypothetical protein